MPKTVFEVLLNLKQKVIHPITFKSKTLPLFLMLFIAQINAFIPAASSQPTINSSPISHSDARCEAQRRLLLKASEGLLYPSESDYPFTYFSFPSVSKLPTPQGFLQLTGQIGQPVTQIDFDELFNRLTKIEPGMDELQILAARRYRLLRSTFKSTYKQLTVHRVGEIQVQVYIAGVNNCGLTGLQTISIET
jgi:hypothetical protein